MTTIQHIFHQFAPEYIEHFQESIPKEHLKVIAAICQCHSPSYRFTVYRCGQCEHLHLIPRSCGNRHCPVCQYAKSQEWLQQQLKKQLPTHYFMITFTVPEEIRSFIRSNQKLSYNALFQASADTIKGFAANPKFVGGQIPGFTGVLHTWGRQMQFHPHIHYIVAGGALSEDQNTWHPADKDYFAPVKAMSKVFREKFKSAMNQLGLIDQIPENVWNKAWNINSQAVGSAQSSFRYLSNYVFKVAISDHRIVKVENRKVTFSWKKSHSNRWRKTTIDVFEFMRRFLQHILPTGFMKVRHYGFCNGAAKVDQTRLYTLVELKYAFYVDSDEHIEQSELLDILCPLCGSPMSYHDTLLPYGHSLVYASALRRSRACAPG